MKNEWKSVKFVPIRDVGLLQFHHTNFARNTHSKWFCLMCPLRPHCGHSPLPYAVNWRTSQKWFKFHTTWVGQLMLNAPPRMVLAPAKKTVLPLAFNSQTVPPLFLQTPQRGSGFSFGNLKRMLRQSGWIAGMGCPNNVFLHGIHISTLKDLFDKCFVLFTQLGYFRHSIP